MWRAVLLGSGLGICLLVLLVGGQWATAEERHQVAGPPPPPNPERAQESVIELRFTEHERLFGRGLDAKVKGTTVTLSGTVHSKAERELAERLALGGAVDKVNNWIIVEPPPREPARLARANPPLTNAERERRRRPAAEPEPEPAPAQREVSVSRAETPAPPARIDLVVPPQPATSAQILREATPLPVVPAADPPDSERPPPTTTTQDDR
jgi:hypothetical protein